jgi:tRNA (cmo5U34)-methyltransferase
MQKDEIFLTGQHKVGSFEFNQDVAQVFDDMVDRSIPSYHEIHRMLLDIFSRLPALRTEEKIVITDLGCSTGSTIKILATYLDQLGKDYEIIGIDQSRPMIEQAQKKFTDEQSSKIQFICDSIQNVKIPKSHFIVMNYTLQFIKMGDRYQMVNDIYNSLEQGGYFLLSEKIHTDDPIFEEMYVDLYYDFKRRNGYSELEISQKREALENVLIPMTPRQLLELMQSSGFHHVEMLFRWYNFASFIGVKSENHSGLSEGQHAQKWLH